jgi:hypothetical protein
MGYSLEAVIATEPVLCELVGSVRQASIVPLGQRLSLLPMRDEFFDAVTVVGAPALDGFWKAPAGFGNVLAACSARGPVAYVEAEYFGGVGTQAALVWDSGAMVLGPLFEGEDESLPGGSPISQALRRLGAVRGDHSDEFEAVGLGRHRDTDNWIRAVD